MARKFAVQWTATAAEMDDPAWPDSEAGRVRQACRDAGHDPGNHEVEITLIEASQGGLMQVRGTVGIRGKWNAGSAHRARDE